MQLVVMFLVMLKFVTAIKLAKGRGYLIVVMVVVASGETPTVGRVNMGLVMLPSMCLYLISIILTAIS
jgi:Sec-independent protein secretion pathway component TatC